MCVGKQKLISHLAKFLAVLIGAGLNATTSFLIQYIIAVNLNVEDYGFYAGIMSMILIVTPLFIMGSPQQIYRKYSTNGYSGDYNVVFIKYSLLIYFIFVLACTFLMEIDLFILLLLSVIISNIYSEIYGAILQGENEFKKLSYWQVANNGIRLVSICSLFYFGFSLINISISIAIASFVFIGTVQTNIIKTNNRKLKFEDLSSITRDGWLYVLASISYLVYFQSDIFILSVLDSNKSAASYSAAMIVLTAAYLLPSVIFQKFLVSKYNYWLVNDKSKLKNIYDFSNKCMFLLGVTGSVFVYIFSDEINCLLFGDKYTNVGEIIRLLSVNIFITYVASSYGGVLMLFDNIKRKALIMLFCAVLNVILNIIFIPVYSYFAAAVSTTITNVIICVSYIYLSRKYMAKIKNERN